MPRLVCVFMFVMPTAWLFGCYLWFRRMHNRWEREIYIPWTDAALKGDDRACQLYNDAARRINDDGKPSLGHFMPWHWWRTWRKPYICPQFDARRAALAPSPPAANKRLQ